ncbi:MAG: PLP-dependent transferase, partial [Crocinitomicaceae bacterium]|nr:PLP-dependent transferase [Crocinitomicaceae bacterium]
TGMACVTSMIAQPFTGSHASMNECEKEEMGLGKNTIRLSFGLEHDQDLIADLEQAFEHVKK